MLIIYTIITFQKDRDLSSFCNPRQEIVVIQDGYGYKNPLLKDNISLGKKLGITQLCRITFIVNKHLKIISSQRINRSN